MAPQFTHARFEGIAALHRDRTALTCIQGELSYAQLNAAANRLAHALVRFDCGTGSPVAVLVDEERADWVIAVLGIWKAGACYLPVDPALPERRIRRMLSAAGVRILVGAAATARPFADVVETTLAPPDCAGEPATDPGVPVPPDGIAYIVHTSGSTGEPKPVAVGHRALMTVFQGWSELYELAAAPRVVLQAAGPAYDVHVGDLVRALWSGGRLVLCPRRVLLDPAELSRLIIAESVDTVELTPAVLDVWTSWLTVGGGRPSCLRLVVSGGEGWTTAGCRALREVLGPGTRIANTYGVAEAAIDSTWCEVDDELLGRLGPADGLPIGTPLPGVQLLVRDAAGADVPDGRAGELWIAGPTVAAGYHRQPDATARRFGRLDDAGTPLYRTGDLVRRAGGLLFHLGRIDDEVKIRGVRVRLDAVEATLRRHPDVLNAAVVRHRRDGDAVLVAHVEARSAEGLAEQLRRHVAAELPAAMVPAQVVVHDRLPLSGSGKVDRSRLAGPAAPEPAAPRGRTAAEERIVAHWIELLGRPPADLGENLFAAGGSSLTAALLSVFLRREFGAEVSVAEIFAEPTVAGLARLAGSPAPADASIPATEHDSGPLAPNQRRLWFLHRLAPDDPSYNLPAVLMLRGPVRQDVLRCSLDRLVQRHEALRTSFEVGPDGPVARVRTRARIPWELIDAPLDGHQTAIDEFARRPFMLGTGRPIRAALVRDGTGRHALVVVVHHIVFDGWSERVFFAELGVIYNALAAGAEPVLPPLPVRPLDLARWESERPAVDLERQRAHWRARFADPVRELPLPEGRRRPPAGRTTPPGVVRRALPPATAQAVRATATRHQTTPYLVLLASFAALLGRWSGQHDLVVGVPFGARWMPETQALIGFGVATLPLRLTVGRDADFRSVLAGAHREFAAATAAAQVPYDEIVAAARSAGGADGPLFRTWFNWLGEDTQAPAMDGLETEMASAPVPGALFDLSVYVTDTGSGYGLSLVHDADLFSGALMEHFADQFATLTAYLCAEPDAPVAAHRLGPADRGWPDLSAESPAVLPTIADVLARSPGEPLIRGPETDMTRGRVRAAAASMTAALLDAGLAAGDTVGILARRTPGLVPALLGVLGAGGRFVVLDADYPPARLAAQLAGAGAGLAVSLDAEVPGELRDGRVWVEPTGEGADAWPLADPGDDAPAYVAVTSGTTGEPKAIVGALRPIGRFLDWYCSRHRIGAADRVAMLSGLSHDPLLRDIFVPLWTGARLCVPPAAYIRAPRELRSWLAAEGVTILHLTPALARLIGLARGAAPLTAARLVVCSGDAVSAAELAAIGAWAPNAEVVHGYGTTETPQLASARSLSPARLPSAGAEAISALSPGAEVVVLDDRGRRAAIGELGAVVVRGPNLALEVKGGNGFEPDPVAGHRRYRTGDLGRYWTDELILLAGRSDDQVKVAGVRIEPAEIDQRLRAHPGVQDAAASARPGADGRDQIVACVVPREGAEPPSLDALRGFLGTALPRFMLPTGMAVLDSIPLTANGKVNRGALPAPPAADPPRTPRDAPAGDLEQLVADVWAGELGVGRPPRDRNFFDLGANSMRIVRVHHAIEDALGQRIPITAFFEHPNIRDLARYLHRGAQEPASVPRTASNVHDLRARRFAARETAMQGEMNT
ncbi:non-ribosomal peptide synthetase [Actinomadura latina]|uniref:Non-ribosomal peptide synthetase n=1 Tax=Actinomadura latina TaxID=163603 RepID=A0A846YUP1_9ACTN|nr:non-ribosomal peptide synthetase [Actinomadura latina]NKZ03437.1 non-ribosomal peptide synthetase [Actinomadura latina]